jgi:hypothetical protein
VFGVPVYLHALYISIFQVHQQNLILLLGTLFLLFNMNAKAPQAIFQVEFQMNESIRLKENTLIIRVFGAYWHFLMRVKV